MEPISSLRPKLALWFVIGLSLAVAAAVSVWQLGADGLSNPDKRGADSAVAFADSAAVPPKAGSLQWPQLAPSDEPTAPAIEPTAIELQARAEAGELQGQYQLARLLMDCLHYQSTDQESLESELIDAAAEDNPFLRMMTRQDNNVQAVQLLLELHKSQLERCEGRSLPPQEERIESMERWLERAASAGHGAAQLAWVQWFRQRWNDPRKVVQAAEQVRIERERAARFLQQALAQGLPEALLAQSIAHRTGDLDRLDPVMAFAYWKAWRLRGAPGAGGVPDWMLSTGDDPGQFGLSAEQALVAQSESERLLARFSR